MGFRLEDSWNSGSSWKGLDGEFRKNPTDPSNHIGKLDQFLGKQRGSFYPDEENIFKAFEATPLDGIKVVIVSQDPYPKGQATGLAFAVPSRSVTRGRPHLPFCGCGHFSQVNRLLKAQGHDEIVW